MAIVRIDASRIESRIERRREPSIRRALMAGYLAGLQAVLDNRPVLPAVHQAHERLERELVELYTEAFLVSGIQASRKIQRTAGRKQILRWQDLPQELPEDLRRGLMKFIAKEVGRKITRMDRTTQDRIAQAVQRAIEEGTPIDIDGPRPIQQGLFDPKALVEQIREIANIDSKYRAHMIAITETHSASQAAVMEAAEATGLVKEKEWISADDPRTRDFHEGIQNVRMDQPFEITLPDGRVEYLDYPGDPAGSPENVINCRCQVVFVV